MKKEHFLYLLGLVMDGCAGLAGLGVPLLAMGIGADYGDLGAIGATGSLAYSAGCFFAGSLADRIGYRRVMTLCSLGMALVFGAYLVVDQLWQLFAIALAGGLCSSGFWPPLQAWLGKGKGRRSLLLAVGRFNVAWSLGFLVGPALAGTLYAHGAAYVFGMAAGLAALLPLGLLFLPLREPEPETTPADTASLAASRLFLPIAWVANFATFFANGTVRSLFPKFATDLGVAPDLLGVLIALIGLTQTTAFLLVSRTESWQFRLGPLTAVQLLAAAGLCTLAFGASPATFAIGLLIQGALVAATFTASIFYSLHAEGPGGQRTGIHEGIVGSGFLVGPLAGGLLADHIGPRAPFLLASAVILAAIALQALILRRGRRRAARPGTRA